jgi:hypothetical protein
MSFVVSSFATASRVDRRSVPSAPVVVHSVSFVGRGPDTTVVASCSDGRSRRMRVSRCASLDEARRLTRALMAYRDCGEPVRFVAAGNNSPDVWFCGILEG